MIEVQQAREKVDQKVVVHQRKVKATFDKGTEKYIFKEGDLVLRWDAQNKILPRET
jgi:hypothetical protein